MEFPSAARPYAGRLFGMIGRPYMSVAKRMEDQDASSTATAEIAK